MTKFFFLFIGVLILSCSAPKKQIEQQSNAAPADTLSQFRYVLQFKGTLPCPDCSGIKTELTLINDNLLYVMKETNLGTSDTPRVTTGEWTTLRGYKKDDDAVVYWLNPEKKDERYYLKTGDSTILMLDKNEEIIQSQMNYSLKMVFEHIK